LVPYCRPYRAGIHCAWDCATILSPLQGLDYVAHDTLLPICRPYRAGFRCTWYRVTNLSPLQGLDSVRHGTVLPFCRPYRAGFCCTWYLVTILSPLQGWIPLRVELCYHTVAPIGLDSVAHGTGLPICRPYGAEFRCTWYQVTNLSPLQGWIPLGMAPCYHTVAPIGQDSVAHGTGLPICRPYRAGFR
jgi:hypothetical protein